MIRRLTNHTLRAMSMLTMRVMCDWPCGCFAAMSAAIRGYVRGYGSAVLRLWFFGCGSAAMYGLESAAMYGLESAMLARSTAMHVRTLHDTCDDANDYYSRLHTLNACTRIRECERVCMRARTRAHA